MKFEGRKLMGEKKEVTEEEKARKKVIEKIKENYNRLNKSMIEEINLSSTHGGLSGSFREESWVKFFRNIIPKKFSLAQGVMIIDSNGKISREVDIAIFDESYTPYIFNYNSLKFIPIEAVACVIESKSKIKNEKDIKDSLKKWARKIDELEANPTGISRVIQGLAIGLTNENQQRTHPLKILVSLYDKSSKTEETTFLTEMGESFDIIIYSVDGGKKFELSIPNEEKDLGWWNRRLNNYSEEVIEKENEGVELVQSKDRDKVFKRNLFENFIKENNKKENRRCLGFNEKGMLTNTLKDLEITDNEILSLTLQLNQLLMLINNPMMFPHFAYAKLFGAGIPGVKKKDKNK